MLAETYIEALLVDEELADQVWELWDAGLITAGLASWAWLLIAYDAGGQIDREAYGRTIAIHQITASL